MCGINGILSDDTITKRKIADMNFLLRHRGPDDEGYAAINTASGKSAVFSGQDSIPYFKNKFPDITQAPFSEMNLYMGHRRLAIIDLSENGHGPMSDSTDNLWITFNGEIYNYIELREELKSHGFVFRTNTDTEVILNAYLKWGAGCLNKFNGMWAFALWDNNKKELLLARDRFGVKPLYFTNNSKYFSFSSEIKALLALDPASFEVNKNRMPFYLLYGNRLNDSATYFNNVNSLLPAHFLILKDGKINVKRYYDINQISLEKFTEKELKDKLVALLDDAIKLRFRSDVPVGTCLSGGFDSSSIVAFSSKEISGGLNTFSAVWKDKNCDESKYIDIANNAFNCNANKIEPSAGEFEKVFAELNYFQEIPTEGPGLYPQWYVMKKAKEKVTVLLDGQGGDEVFGGYFMMGTYLRAIIKDRNYTSFVSDFKHYFKFLRSSGIHSFSGWMFPKLYNKVVRGFLSEKSNILNKDLAAGLKKSDLHYDSDPPKKFKSYINNMSYHFITSNTIPALLHYEDRSSMAHSIESRVPFLDYRLVEFGLSLPKIYLAHKGTSRPLYRKALSEYLPKEIANRTDKLGYPTPFTVWTRTNLKSYILDVFKSPASGFFDFINREYLEIVLKEHFAEKKDYGWEIWRMLSMDQFLRLKTGITEKLTG